MPIRADRPRIFLSPTILTELKRRAANGSPRWQALKQAVDRPGADWEINIGNYSMAYVVTGDASYAAKAFTLMKESMAAGLGQVTPDSGYPCRTYFLGASLCLDWLYPALTPEDRAALIANMELCCAWPWPDTNPSRAGAWGVDNPGSNYFYGFLMTWIAGLALAGDSAQAQAIADLARSKWTGLSLPYLGSEARGGWLYEGTSYSVDSLAFMLMCLMAEWTAGGPVALPPWCSQALIMLAHMTTPAMDAFVPWGDQTKSAGGALQDGARAPFLLGAAFGMPWPKTWLDNTIPGHMQQHDGLWKEFLWYPEGTVGQDYRQIWAPRAFAAGADVATSRSSWASNALFFTLEAGPVRESHQDRAAGAFGICVGNEWLAAWAKVTSHSGIAQETVDSNCVSIAGQRQSWTQDTAAIEIIEQTDVYTYARADLTGAYTDHASSVKREYLYLLPNLWLIHDQLAGVAAGAPVLWHLHTGGISPSVGGPGFQVTGKGMSLFGIPVVPATGALAIVRLTNDRDPGVIGFRIDVGDQGAREFLIGLEAAPQSQSPGNYRAWVDPAGRGLMRASTAAVGPALAIWANGPGPWNYVSPGSGRHVIVGAAPGVAYQAAGQTVTASAGGVLMFDGPASGVTVAVTAGDGGGGGGTDLTRRTFSIVEGSLITDAGATIKLVGGQLVVVALPGAAEPPAKKRKTSK